MAKKITVPVVPGKELISKAEAARRCGVSRQYMHTYIKKYKENLEWVFEIGGNQFIDARKMKWKKFAKEMRSKDLTVRTNVRHPERGMTQRAIDQRISREMTKLSTISGADSGNLDDIATAALSVERAKNEQEISKAKIAKEKAAQLEIKTLEMTRKLGSIELIKYYFSFAENMFQNLYGRPHEIEAELESLFLAGNKKLATEKIIREMQAIVKNNVAELEEAMKKEGYSTQRLKNKGITQNYKVENRRPAHESEIDEVEEMDGLDDMLDNEIKDEIEDKEGE